MTQTKRLPMVALIGVDGSGKSAVITALKREFRHPGVNRTLVVGRPSKSSHGRPIRNHEKPPHYLIVSLIKLAIKTAQWLFRYSVELRPLSSQSVLIIFDHFQFLLMALDPLKYRYRGPRQLLWWFFKTLPQPDIFIILDVPFEVAYRRKQEVAPDELQQLIAEQRACLGELKRAHVIDASNPLERVVSDVARVITDELESKP